MFIFICPPPRLSLGGALHMLHDRGLFAQGCLVVTGHPDADFIGTTCLLRGSRRCARLEAGFCASPTGQPQDADLCRRWLSCSFGCCSSVHRCDRQCRQVAVRRVLFILEGDRLQLVRLLREARQWLCVEQLKAVE